MTENCYYTGSIKENVDLFSEITKNSPLLRDMPDGFSSYMRKLMVHYKIEPTGPLIRAIEGAVSAIMESAMRNDAISYRNKAYRDHSSDTVNAHVSATEYAAIMLFNDPDDSTVLLRPSRKVLLRTRAGKPSFTLKAAVNKDDVLALLLSFFESISAEVVPEFDTVTCEVTITRTAAECWNSKLFSKCPVGDCLKVTPSEAYAHITRALYNGCRPPVLPKFADVKSPVIALEYTIHYITQGASAFCTRHTTHCYAPLLSSVFPQMLDSCEMRSSVVSSTRSMGGWRVRGDSAHGLVGEEVLLEAVLSRTAASTVHVTSVRRTAGTLMVVTVPEDVMIGASNVFNVEDGPDSAYSIGNGQDWSGTPRFSVNTPPLLDVTDDQAHHVLRLGGITHVNELTTYPSFSRFEMDNLPLLDHYGNPRLGISGLLNYRFLIACQAADARGAIPYLELALTAFAIPMNKVCSAEKIICSATQAYADIPPPSQINVGVGEALNVIKFSTMVWANVLGSRATSEKTKDCYAGELEDWLRVGTDKRGTGCLLLARACSFLNVRACVRSSFTENTAIVEYEIGKVWNVSISSRADGRTHLTGFGGYRSTRSVLLPGTVIIGPLGYNWKCVDSVGKVHAMLELSKSLGAPSYIEPQAERRLLVTLSRRETRRIAEGKAPMPDGVISSKEQDGRLNVLFVWDETKLSNVVKRAYVRTTWVQTGQTQLEHGRKAGRVSAFKFDTGAARRCVRARREENVPEAVTDSSKSHSGRGPRHVDENTGGDCKGKTSTLWEQYKVAKDSAYLDNIPAEVFEPIYAFFDNLVPARHVY